MTFALSTPRMIAGTRQWFLRNPPALDLLLAVLVVGLALGPFLSGTGWRPERPGGIVYVALLPGFVALATRRRWPRAALPIATAGLVWQVGFGGNWDAVLVVITGVVAYAMAIRTPRRVTWLLAVACGIVLYAAYGIWAGEGLRAVGSLPVLAFIGMVVAVGDATRNRRAYLAEIEERARRAEESRDEVARRRVVEERLRIARELHDVVAHHITVINMQAGGASRVLDRRPDQARAALATIGEACDLVLKELGSVVGVLRQADDPDAVTGPARGLARLPELLTAVASAGLHVTDRSGTDRSGTDARELPAVVDLAAYRIVQEALTNAQKYGTGTAELTIGYTRAGVVIDVVNPVAAPPRSGGSGYGLVGMRERAAAAGGTLSARPDGTGRFVVHAELSAPKENG
ncbi:sensor histidine kinase [Cryptosporangium sp. NPDC048952]|uniref:sensor histidine kinase n=1 Tax=Cryptosporangium sp. NPDC048952 TaxID=3363961 RepID=UPI00371801B2